jgi:DNA/RNA endonuclease YhcR with UshA esterase domain
MDFEEMTMRTKLICVVASAVTLLSVAALPVLAHHSFAAEFDANRPVTLEGVVKEFRWVNPHSWLHINVTNEDGTVSEWAVEGGAPSALLRRGWDKNTLPAGTRVTVQGFQAKDGALRANARDITFPDGKTLFMGSSGTGAPDERREQR